MNTRILNWARSPKTESLLSLAAGALLVLAFSPFGIWPMAALSLAATFYLWQEHAPRRAFWLGWLFGLGAFGAGTYWLYVSLHVFGQVPLPLAILLMGLLVCFLALYPAVVAALAARLTPSPGWRRELLVLPALWAAMEWFRGWFLTGFPWLAVGYTQTDSPLAGAAPVIGVYGLSFLVALSAGLVLRFLANRSRARLPAAAGVLAIWLATFGLGQIEWTQPVGPERTAALVQGNVSQDEKWLPEEREPTIELYRRLSEPHWGQADTIIWPEAALPFLHHQIRTRVIDPLAERADESGTDFLMGILTREPNGDFYNTVRQVHGEERFYRKNQLVPFGEFFPVPGFVREWLRLMNLPYSDFQRGSRDQTPLTLDGRPVATSICYEDVFPRVIYPPMPEAGLLVNVSNDAWFGESIAPHQHLQIARMRSLETGREMLRTTNNGITAVIDHKGQVRARFPQFEAGVLEARYQHREGATPIVITGNLVLLPVLILLVGVGGFWRRRL